MVVNPSYHKVKVGFEMVKERVHMYQDGKHKEFLLTLEKQPIQLEGQYILYEEGK